MVGTRRSASVTSSTIRRVGHPSRNESGPGPWRWKWTGAAWPLLAAAPTDAKTGTVSANAAAALATNLRTVLPPRDTPSALGVFLDSITVPSQRMTTIRSTDDK